MLTEEKLIIAMNRIVREAESWIGTPYRWNCKVKGERGGVACGDILEQIYKNLGGLPRGYKIPEFVREWHMKPQMENFDPLAFVKEMEKFAVPIEDWEQRRPTDVCMMQWAGIQSHVALLVRDDCIIHAVNERKVMKHRLRSFRANLTGIYRPYDDILLRVADFDSKAGLKV